MARRGVYRRASRWSNHITLTPPMAKFVLDTGIILGYVRAAGYAEYVEKKFGLFNPPNIPLVSVVSKGEIYSLAVQLRWGGNKLNTLEEILRKLPLVDINDEQIIRQYAEIDAYSLSKDLARPLPRGQTARVMGKNDLWIAATASVLNATLLTIDHDFDHLDDVFFSVVYVDQKLTAADGKP